MDPVERAQFLASISEAANLIRQVQNELRRARSACHGELFEHVDLAFTRAYELLVRAEWMRQVALGNVPVSASDVAPENREGPDRRRGVDRRIAGLRKLLRQLENLENA